MSFSMKSSLHCSALTKGRRSSLIEQLILTCQIGAETMVPLRLKVHLKTIFFSFHLLLLFRF